MCNAVRKVAAGPPAGNCGTPGEFGNTLTADETNGGLKI